MQLRAYKFRLYPTEEQKVFINKTIGCARKVYNLILSDNIQSYAETKKSNFPQPTKYKKEFEFLKEVDSLALANARINIQKAFSNFFRRVKQPNKEKGFPKFKSKKHPKQSYTTNNQNGTIKIEKGFIKLPKIGFIKCKFHRRVNGTIRSATVRRNSQGNYFVSILTVQQPTIIERDCNEEKILGIDMSFQNFAVLSNGDKINPPKFYYEAEKKIAKLGRKVSKCKKESNNRQKKRMKKARYEEHVSHKRKDFTHKLSKRLVDDYDVIVVEDINLPNLAKHKNWGKTINNLGFGMFRIFLEYKCNEKLKVFVKADRFFPSSQLCSVCGHQNKETKDLSVREWSCPICNTQHNRDINAANNLVNWYKNKIAMERSEFTPVGDGVRLDVSQAVVVESGKVLKQNDLRSPSL